MRITILGCGASAGVPMIGCDCEVCTSADSKNQRLRASILIETEHKTVLIDASPDLRQQALQHSIRAVDGVIITHMHADHTHGIDDLRSFNYLQQDAIPLYADKITLTSLQERFPYCFAPPASPGGIWYCPALKPHVFEYNKAFSIGDTEWIPFFMHHGKGHSTGLRVADFAYTTDVSTMPEGAFAHLKGLKLWVVDCLSPDPTLSHAHLALTLSWIERMQPERAILIHMGHHFEYTALKKILPTHVEPAYDGMVLFA
jgi:phosphoribosyl 1,2-cyclic phosphate phosphodiesterase